MFIKITKQRGGSIKNNKCILKLVWDYWNDSFAEVHASFVFMHKPFKSQAWDSAFSFLLFKGNEDIENWKKYGSVFPDIIKLMNEKKLEVTVDNTFFTSQYSHPKRSDRFDASLE